MRRMLALSAALALLAACAGVESRIKKHRAAFDASAPDVQEKIRQGRADVGFTREQAAIALGRPDRVYTRKTADSEQEVWSYGRGGGARPSIGFGFGVSGGGPGFYGGGVGVEQGWDPGERLRLAFENGRVVSVEDKRR